jgi:hypothetical protein
MMKRQEYLPGSGDPIVSDSGIRGFEGSTRDVLATIQSVNDLGTHVARN